MSRDPQPSLSQEAETKMKIGGLEIRTSEKVPRDEIWFCEPIGYEKQESLGRHGWSLSIIERFRVIGKVINVGR